MKQLTIDAGLCNGCGVCKEACAFQAVEITKDRAEINAACRMCGACVKACPQNAVHIEETPDQKVDKSQWKDIYVFMEQANGKIHPCVYELIGEALKLADPVGFGVCVIAAGGNGTAENAEKLLKYGVKKVFVYEAEELADFRVDTYTNVMEDVISSHKPSVVLIGATSVGRSLAPRISARFHTGLTADCTCLKMRENTDLVQIRPAFGGNIMAQILIQNHRPQFATVRYKVMDRAQKVENPDGQLVMCSVTEEMLKSGIEILETRIPQQKEGIEDAEVLVAAGRGVKSQNGMKLVKELANQLGGRVAYTRPMVEAGYGLAAEQIGLSGRTVKPKLIITCGVSGAIQFTSAMNQAECIVAINQDPDAPIFKTAHYCIVDDLNQAVPALIEQLKLIAENEEV
ncbi:electron transfer flavoprotein subunit alpha [Clostridium sp. MCC353]|uniref:electron transfer flavoprotein subunit alpha n=1 Tax=Clostridium sp. MCC353 TaxID=2592646 RepID=UPI001C036044|nr:electron transfer flavoprotein subunit alpha [Clostridium sp. MCC353]MBT9779533.1 electron transfer flavoprotein subunit alpha [Clostridium sp. MCC353]